jgi:hypothetical protein
MDLTLTAHTATTDFALPAPGDIPDTFPPGRRCVEDGCITLLSMFNPGPWCYCHAAGHEAEVQKAIAEAELARERRSHVDPTPLKPGGQDARSVRRAAQRAQEMRRLDEVGVPRMEIAHVFGLTAGRVTQILGSRREAVAA